MSKTENPFVALAAINVNDRIEKKNGLSYLSWAWAVDQLLRLDPNATWEYGTPTAFGETLMVHCAVTAFGKSMTAHLPVMNHRNQAIQNPDAFAVNTAMQRCLVKAIALHGLGLYIYAGEDLPDGEEKPKHAAERPGDGKDVRNSATQGAYESLDHDMQIMVTDAANRVRTLLHSNDDAGAWAEFHEADALLGDQETARAALRALLDSKDKSRIKKAAELERKAA